MMSAEAHTRYEPGGEAGASPVQIALALLVLAATAAVVVIALRRVGV
jgi:hypothetical protein